MGAVRVRLRAELRHGWRSWVALALIIGAFSGVVLGTAIGARRTSTAYPRMVDRSGRSDALIGAFNTGLNGYYAALASRPEVDEFALIAGMPIFPADDGGQPIFIDGNAVAPIDGRFGTDIDRPDLVAGRRPRPDRADEVLINEAAAATLHTTVGARLPMVVAEELEPPKLAPIEVTVVGIGRFVQEIISTTKFGGTATILMTPAAYEQWGRPVERLNWDGAYVRLRPGGMAAFRAAAESMAAADPEQTGGQVLFADHDEHRRLVEQTIAPQPLALWIFAAFAGIAGAFVLGQALDRHVADDTGDAATLRALGFTRRQVFALAIGRAVVVSAAAVVVATAVAVATSPLFPIGAARRAEENAGMEVNLAFLAVGAAVIATVFVARGALPAWRGARAPTAAASTTYESSAATRRIMATALPPSAATGVRMALEPGRGRTAVPVRTTIVGAVLGLAAIAATVTFGANMNRLVDTPRLYGRTWGLTFDGSFGLIPLPRVQAILDQDPAIARWSGGVYAEGTIDGQPVTALGLRGQVQPAIVEGRAATAADEVVLGTTTLRRTQHRVGDRVSLKFTAGSREVTVVGRAVFPALGRGSFSQTGVGEGALITSEAAEVPVDDGMKDELGEGPYFNFYLIELRPETSAADAAALGKRLEVFCPEDQDCRATVDPTRDRPAQIANLDRIRWTPVVLAGLLAALATATVTHTLVASIRRRRRDLALLKTVGFLRGQISAAVAWQASTIAVIAAAVGIPLGVALGRVLWRALAEQMGIVPDVITPAVAVGLAGPATIVVVNLIAIVPGWIAGRIRPAVALRSE